MVSLRHKPSNIFNSRFFRDLSIFFYYIAYTPRTRENLCNISMVFFLPHLFLFLFLNGDKANSDDNW